MESQEAKLKKIRAMRGQADYSKVTNGNLCTCGPRPFLSAECVRVEPAFY